MDSQKNSRVPFLSKSRPCVKASGSCGYSFTTVKPYSCGPEGACAPVRSSKTAANRAPRTCVQAPHLEAPSESADSEVPDPQAQPRSDMGVAWVRREPWGGLTNTRAAAMLLTALPGPACTSRSSSPLPWVGEDLLARCFLLMWAGMGS